jgi:hypothetical protein
VGLPLLLAAHLSLDHDMLDMATHYDSVYDVTTELLVDPSGNATFHVWGNVTSKGVELTPGAGTTVMPTHATRIDDTWSGHATVAPGALVIRFDHGANFPGGVDVEWRCNETHVAVSSIMTSVWKCATSQSMTRPTGPAHALPEYMRVESYLSSPPVPLRVDATARGGANHRSTMTSVRLSR